ncbi:MAG: rod shape-determining protein MreC [Marinilabiliales bacterium]
MLVQFNYYHKASFINSANSITGYIYENYSDAIHYFNLKYQNQKLHDENTRLHNALEKCNQNRHNPYSLHENYPSNKYIYHTARVIYNSVNKLNNYLIIDIGSNDNIKKDMAVINTDGVIGVIKETGKHYSTVISLLNLRFSIGAKIKNNNYFGVLSWNGKDYMQCKLSEIPRHAEINIGDTVVTSGYSAIFPENVPIGIISDFYIDDSYSFYDIDVKLFNDYKRVYQVYVVENKHKDEINELLEKSND